MYCYYLFFYHELASLSCPNVCRFLPFCMCRRVVCSSWSIAWTWTEIVYAPWMPDHIPEYTFALLHLLLKPIPLFQYFLITCNICLDNHHFIVVCSSSIMTCSIIKWLHTVGDNVMDSSLRYDCLLLYICRLSMYPVRVLLEYWCLLIHNGCQLMHVDICSIVVTAEKAQFDHS